MTTMDAPKVWLTSQDARRRLKVSDCELMHLREQGELRFKKYRNAFLYLSQDVQHLAHSRSVGRTSKHH